MQPVISCQVSESSPVICSAPVWSRAALSRDFPISSCIGGEIVLSLITCPWARSEMSHVVRLIFGLLANLPGQVSFRWAISCCTREGLLALGWEMSSWTSWRTGPANMHQFSFLNTTPQALREDCETRELWNPRSIYELFISSHTQKYECHLFSCQCFLLWQEYIFGPPSRLADAHNSASYLKDMSDPW